MGKTGFQISFSWNVALHQLCLYVCVNETMGLCALLIDVIYPTAEMIII
uniref:Uncharacterized protein n=1 Tax=Anguilla anguilla TaxID=7936 RepID=A0A0E9RRD1_ANGAN